MSVYISKYGKINMDFAMQQEVWSRLPLNDDQRNDMLRNLIADLQVDSETKSDPDKASEGHKKRKRSINEQCDGQNHTH